MIKKIITLLFCAWLAACTTTPAPEAPKARWSPEQVALLKSQGFELTDEGWALLLSSKFQFKFNEDSLSSDVTTQVQQLANNLWKVGIDQFRVEGHSDSQGAAAYNDALSKRRAQSVADAMTAGGIPSQSIRVVGYGFKRPLVQGNDAAARSQNRRVALVVPLD